MPHRGWHRGGWVAASSVPHSGVIWSLQLRGGRGGGSLVASTRTPSWPPRGTPGSAPSPRAEPRAPQLLPIAAPCPPCRPPAFRPGPASAEAVGNRRNPALSRAVPTFPVGKLRHGDGLCVTKSRALGFNPSPALPGLQQHLPSFVYNPEGIFFFFFPLGTSETISHLLLFLLRARFQPRDRSVERMSAKSGADPAGIFLPQIPLPGEAHSPRPPTGALADFGFISSHFGARHGALLPEDIPLPSGAVISSWPGALKHPQTLLSALSGSQHWEIAVPTFLPPRKYLRL